LTKQDWLCYTNRAGQLSIDQAWNEVFIGQSRLLGTDRERLVNTAILNVPLRAVCYVFLTFVVVDVSPGQFTTIINIPPDPSFGNEASIGSNTQLNLSDGGAIGNLFRAGGFDGPNVDVEVNISGGTVGNSYFARSGSVTNISGGSIGNFFRAWDGSKVNVTGGSLGPSLKVYSGGKLNISGGSFGDGISTERLSELRVIGTDFRLDGQLIDGLETVGSELIYSPPGNSVLTGILLDGTPFAFSIYIVDSREHFSSGTLTLEAGNPPASGPSSINAPNDQVPLGIVHGQTLTVAPGGVIKNNFTASWGSAVQLNGGIIGNNFEAVGAQFAITTGTVGNDFDAFNGSTININGGFVGMDFDAFNGSTINITGGTINAYFDAHAGSTVNLSGGDIRDYAEISGVLNVSGGFVREGFRSYSGSEINVSGGSIAEGFWASKGSTISVSDGTIGPDFRLVGSLLTVSGGTIGRSALVDNDSTLVIKGGIVGNDLFVRDNCTVVISGGSVGSGSSMRDSVIKISGGGVGDEFRADDSMIEISGGSIDDEFQVSGGTIDISGGSIGDNFRVSSDTVANISGGIFGEGFSARQGSTINLLGRQFILNDVDITSSLVAQIPITILDRNVTLEAVLNDGSQFSIDLNTAFNLGDYFSENALLTVTSIPEPAVSSLCAMALLLSARRQRLAF
jgi:hypothetical protein